MAATTDTRAAGNQSGDAQTAESTTERPADCTCRTPEDALACFECYLAGYRQPNPEAPVDTEEGDQ